MKFILTLAAIVYIVSPVDLFPGPIDDAIVTGVAYAICRMFGTPTGGNGQGQIGQNNQYRNY